MTVSVEWRINQGSEAIVVVDDNEGAVTEAMTPDAPILKDFLAVTSTIDRWRQWPGWHSVDRSDRKPEGWGDLLISRKDDGQVLDIDPELFWEAVRRWFRAHGVDYNT